MKAVFFQKYGSPDVLELREVAKPAPADNEVLIRIRAASVNAWDLDLLGGKLLARLAGGGLFQPRHNILGGDIAGQVEAVGKKVKRFRPGDEVFGDRSGRGWGGFAEYVCADENVWTPKAASMTFEQAAAIPQAGLLALQGLRDKRKIQPGDRVLINGAGGGVGSFAIQIAKLFGAEVTGVDHTGKLEFMRSLGADQVIDYTKEDFTRNEERYDLILDVFAHHSLSGYARVLSSTGMVVIVGGATTAAILKFALLGPLLSKRGKKEFRILAWRPDTGDLDQMKAYFEAGDVVPVIDRRYPLSETAEALRYLGNGRARGKVVIKI